MVIAWWFHDDFDGDLNDEWRFTGNLMGSFLVMVIWRMISWGFKGDMPLISWDFLEDMLILWDIMISWGYFMEYNYFKCMIYWYDIWGLNQPNLVFHQQIWVPKITIERGLCWLSNGFGIENSQINLPRAGGIRPYSGDCVLGYFMGCLTDMGYLGMIPKMSYAVVCPKTATLIVKWW